MGKHKSILLCMGTEGLGEAAQGLSIAAELQQRGAEPYCLISPVSEPIFKPSAVAYEIYPASFVSMLPEFIGERFGKLDSVCVCDIFAHNGIFKKFGLPWPDVRALAADGYVIDTWSFVGRENASVDFIDYGAKEVDPWPLSNFAILSPVPFTSPKLPAFGFNALPAAEGTSVPIRRHVRASLGVEPHQKMILFCTSPWQHAHFGSRTVLEMASVIPVVLGDLFLSIDHNFVLVHVGPVPVQGLESSERYTWISTLKAEQFSAMLGACDVFLSLNFSGRTVTRAVALAKPVLYVQNSFDFTRDLEVLYNTRGWSRNWMRKLGCAKPFRMWPLGFAETLQPMIAGSRYTETMAVCELGDEAHLVRTMAALANDQGEISALKRIQEQYCASLHREYKSAGELILSRTGQ